MTEAANTSEMEPYALTVDDDIMILMDACDILADAGFMCLEAKTGDEAKMVLAEHGSKLTMLFTDVEMPGETDGFALARYAAATFPDIEIVIASGRISPKEGDLPDRATFINKPFSAQLIHEHLREKLPPEKTPDPLKE